MGHHYTHGDRVHEEEGPYHHYVHQDDGHHHEHHHDKEYVTSAKEALAHHQAKHVEELHEAIEQDFTHKLMDYKKKQTGHEYRLFGHTMVSYD